MPSSQRRSSSKSPYSVHPGVAMVQKWIADLPAKTGRSLPEWIDLVKSSGPPTAEKRRDWLKSRHGMGTNAAWWIAERAEGKGLEDGDPEAYLEAAVKYVDEMYAGGKSGLRPIYDRLLALGLDLGGDVKACPCKTMVPLYRAHVFAQLKPTTRSRIDLGLALAGLPKSTLSKRLLDTGGLGKGDRITHRIPLTSVAEIDADVGRWLKTAYDLDG